MRHEHNAKPDSGQSLNTPSIRAYPEPESRAEDRRRLAAMRSAQEERTRAVEAMRGMCRVLHGLGPDAVHACLDNIAIAGRCGDIVHRELTKFARGVPPPSAGRPGLRIVGGSNAR